MELTVVAEDMAAICLFSNRGFTIEGTRRDSMFIDGRFHDELYMAKLIRDDGSR